MNVSLPRTYMVFHDHAGGITEAVPGTDTHDRREAMDTAHRLSWENKDNAYSVRRGDGKIMLKVCHSRIRPKLDHAALVLGVGDAS